MITEFLKSGKRRVIDNLVSRNTRIWSATDTLGSSSTIITMLNKTSSNTSAHHQQQENMSFPSLSIKTV